MHDVRYGSHRRSVPTPRSTRAYAAFPVWFRARSRRLPGRVVPAFRRGRSVARHRYGAGSGKRAPRCGQVHYSGVYLSATTGGRAAHGVGWDWPGCCWAISIRGSAGSMRGRFASLLSGRSAPGVPISDPSPLSGAADRLHEIRTMLGEAARTGRWTPDPVTTRLLDQLTIAL